jgi:hypothetical protein
MRTFLFSCLPIALAACSASPQSENVASTRAALSEVEDLRVKVESITYSGDLCPPNTLAIIDGTPDTPVDAFTIATSASYVAVTSTPAAARCQFVVEMTVPDGYQMGSPIGVARGFVMTSPQSTVILGTNYAFDGASGARPYVNDVTNAKDGLFETIDEPKGLWSPTCGGSHVARLLIDVVAAAIGQDTYVSLDSYDMGLTYRDGVQFRRCGETEPLEAPPGAKGQYCGGIIKRPCAQGLACQYDLEYGPEDYVEGACVDPTEQVPPQPVQGKCGGYQQIACEPGLACWHSSTKAEQNEHTGRCTPASGGAGDLCGGSPVVPCAAGFACVGESCAVADGTFNAACGDGLTACNAGLHCASARCVSDPVGEGGTCGGDRSVPCAKGLKCTKASKSDPTGVCAKP